MTRKTDDRDTPSPITHLTCQQATDLIIDYMTDTMHAAMRAAFEAHAWLLGLRGVFTHLPPDRPRHARPAC